MHKQHSNEQNILVTQTQPGFFSLGIRQKVGLVLVFVLLVSLGLTGWHSLQQQEARVLEETKTRGSDLNRFTAQSVAYSIVGYDYHTIQLLLDELVKSQDINYAKVTNNKGNVMAKAGHLSTQNVTWTYFEEDVIFDETIVGKLSIQLDNSKIIDRFSEQRSELVQREILLILLMAISVYLALSYFIIRPIVIASDKLRDNYNDGNLKEVNLEYEENDELGYLFSHFNAMQERLGETSNLLKSKVELANKEVQKKNIHLQKQSDELKEINKKLELLSITDSLTELFNRRHFDILLRKEISYAQRHQEKVSLVIFDLDHFKSINDEYGHSVGDATLFAVAKIIEDSTRESDICCRIGGEEFAVICRETDMHAIRIIAENLRLKLESTPIHSGQHEFSITASFGMMTFSYLSGQSVSSDDIYHCADMAMYHSKQQGRNRISHFADITVDIHRPNVGHL